MSNTERGSEELQGRVGHKADRQWFREKWTPEDIGAIYRAGVRHESEANRKWAQFAARVIHGYECQTSQDTYSDSEPDAGSKTELEGSK